MRLTNWSGLTDNNELTNGGIKMNKFVGNVDCSNLYTTMKDLSNTCKSVTQISVNNFAKTLTNALKPLQLSDESSKSLVKLFALL